MAHLIRKYCLNAALFVLIGTLTASSTPKKEYLTEDELDLIRDAQELKERIPVYFELAQRRLIILGVSEKSDKQKEKERKAQEQYEKDKKKAGANKGAPIKPPADSLLYLHDFTRPELLRGIVQVIDEVMNTIDDNFERKLDVRGSLEQLDKFTRETLPMLEKFEPKTANKKTALAEAIEKAKEGNAGAKDALKKVPKTEKKPEKPDRP